MGENQEKIGTDLDVLCVGCLQFFSKVRVCLQNLNHLSEIPVVVKASVLQERTGYSQQTESKLMCTTETTEAITPFSSGTSSLGSWLSPLRSIGTDQTPAEMDKSSSQPGFKFILLQNKQ